MSGIATAMVASAVVGGVAANKAGKKAAKATDAASQRASDTTTSMAKQGRQDVTDNMAIAQDKANLGFQGALDVFGQSAPAQMDVFQQGNIGAQQALISGLPQIQNAILGGNVDLSGLQPFQVQQPDLSFLQQQTPINIYNQQQEQQRQQQEQQRLQQVASSTGPVQFPAQNIGLLGGARPNSQVNFIGRPNGLQERSI